MSELRGNFDAIEMRAKQKAKYKDAEKRIRKPKTQFGDESNGLVFHQHDKFRIEVFLPILDKLSQALTLRTQAYDVVHKRFGLITEFLSMGADEIEKAAHNLQQCYPNDLELSFPQEFIHFSCFIERLNSDEEMPTCTFTCTATQGNTMVILPCFTILYNIEQPWFFQIHRCCYTLL